MFRFSSCLRYGGIRLQHTWPHNHFLTPDVHRMTIRLRPSPLLYVLNWSLHRNSSVMCSCSGRREDPHLTDSRTRCSVGLECKSLCTMCFQDVFVHRHISRHLRFVGEKTGRISVLGPIWYVVCILAMVSPWETTYICQAWQWAPDPLQVPLNGEVLVIVIALISSEVSAQWYVH